MSLFQFFHNELHHSQAQRASFLGLSARLWSEIGIFHLQIHLADHATETFEVVPLLEFGQLLLEPSRDLKVAQSLVVEPLDASVEGAQETQAALR